MEERELIRRCLQRDERAWEEIVRKYGPIIRKLARNALRSLHRTPSEPEIDEIAAAALEALVANDFRVLRSFRWQCSLESWLRIIVRTACLRSIRRKIPDPQDVARPGNLELPIDRLLSEEARAAVRQALSELPDRERQALSMFFIDGLPYQEISSRLDLPMGTVATILSRTRARLREVLRAKGIGG